MVSLRHCRTTRAGFACFALCMLAAGAPVRAADGLDPLIKSYDDAVRVFVETSGKGGGANEVHGNTWREPP